MKTCKFSGSDSYTIFDCFFSVEAQNGQLYPSEPIHNLQRMERKVLLALSQIKDIEIRQRHGYLSAFYNFVGEFIITKEFWKILFLFKNIVT